MPAETQNETQQAPQAPIEKAGEKASEKAGPPDLRMSSGEAYSMVGLTLLTAGFALALWPAPLIAAPLFAIPVAFDVYKNGKDNILSSALEDLKEAATVVLKDLRKRAPGWKTQLLQKLRGTAPDDMAEVNNVPAREDNSLSPLSQLAAAAEFDAAAKVAAAPKTKPEAKPAPDAPKPPRL